VADPASIHLSCCRSTVQASACMALAPRGQCMSCLQCGNLVLNAGSACLHENTPPPYLSLPGADMNAVPGSACLPARWHSWSDAPLGRVRVLDVCWDHAQPALALTHRCLQSEAAAAAAAAVGLLLASQDCMPRYTMLAA
jgi:hypothetical protein